MTVRLVAGVDSSTQSTKVEVRNLDTGEVVARGSAPHPPTTPPRSEQDPQAWWSAFETAWAAAGSPDVEAISVGGQQHGMVVLDADRQVVRPAKLWNDTETAPDAGWLLKQLPGGARRLGRSRRQCAGRGVHRGEVELAPSQRARQLGAVGTRRPASRLDDVPTHRRSGDRPGRCLRDRLLVACLGGVSVGHPVDHRQGPRLVRCRASRGRARRRSSASGTERRSPAAPATTWPPRSASVCPPASPCCRSGTSGTAFAMCDQPSNDPSGAVAGFADATGSFLPLACTLNATKVTDAIARLLGVDHAELDRLALAAPAGAGGLTLLPYFDGERTPNLPKSTGLLAGVRSDVSREQLARAAVEGVVCGLLDALDALGAQAPLRGRPARRWRRAQRRVPAGRRRAV